MQSFIMLKHVVHIVTIIIFGVFKIHTDIDTDLYVLVMKPTTYFDSRLVHVRITVRAEITNTRETTHMLASFANKTD
jgi:hypothetical protein